jgi:cell shape-determining protein MreC
VAVPVKPNRGLLLVVLLIASAVLTLLGPAAASDLRGAVQLLSLPFAPLNDGGMYLVTATKRHFKTVERLTRTEARDLQQRNRALQRRNAALWAELIEARQRLAGGQALYSRAFSPRTDIPVQFISGRILARGSLPYGWTGVVNVGSRDGVEPGMAVTQKRLLLDRAKSLPENLAVLSESALAGWIVEAGAYTARVRLVTDRGFELPGQIWRVLAENPANRRVVQVGARMRPLTPALNRPVEVFARGDGRDGLVAREVRTSHAIRPGDVLQTRPDLGRLPAAVTVGTVREVLDDPDNAGMVILHVDPAVDPAALRNVYVVLPRLAPLEGDGP